MPDIYSKSVILEKAFAEMGGVRVPTKHDVIGPCVTWLIADLIKQAQLSCCYRFKVIPSVSLAAREHGQGGREGSEPQESDPPYLVTHTGPRIRGRGLPTFQKFGFEIS